MTKQPEPTVEPEAGASANQQPEPEGRDSRRDEHTRQRLREVESERDALCQRLDARDQDRVRQIAQRVRGERGMALFSDFDLAALRNADGDVDEALVQQAVEPIRAALEEGRVTHHGDLGPRKTTGASRASWGEVIGRGR
jgi:hypothetical protein